MFHGYLEGGRPPPGFFGVWLSGLPTPSLVTPVVRVCFRVREFNLSPNRLSPLLPQRFFPFAPSNPPLSALCEGALVGSCHWYSPPSFVTPCLYIETLFLFFFCHLPPAFPVPRAHCWHNPSSSFLPCELGCSLYPWHLTCCLSPPSFSAEVKLCSESFNVPLFLINLNVSVPSFCFSPPTKSLGSFSPPLQLKPAKVPPPSCFPFATFPPRRPHISLFFYPLSNC